MATLISNNGDDGQENTDEHQSQDVVDHCVQLSGSRLNPTKGETQTNRTKKLLVSIQKNLQYPANHSTDDLKHNTNATGNRRKSAFEHLPIFHFQRKRGGSAPVIHSINATPASTKERPTFVKSSSIARLFGNTYNTKQSENDPTPVSKGTTNKSESNSSKKQHYSHQHHYPERFQACGADHECTDSPSNVVQSSQDPATPFDVHAANPFRSLSRGLGRLLWKKSYSVSISEPDPEFKVAYLGNVLTGWAKGKIRNNQLNMCVLKHLG